MSLFNSGLFKKRQPPKKFTSLAEFAADRRAESAKHTVKITKAMEQQLEKGKIRDLVFTATEYRQLNIKPEDMSDTASFLMNSNLFFIREDINSPPLTMGCDPEFILCDADNPDKVALLSSQHALPHSPVCGYISMAELAVGADYGLLEIRPEASPDVNTLVNNVSAMIESFHELQDELKEAEYDEEIGPPQRLLVKEVEAVEFNHKRSRMRQLIENEELDFGIGLRDKVAGVAASSTGDVGLAAAENYGVSLSAYDKPAFVQGNDCTLTAGGHLHYGGWRVKLLSIKQLKAVIKEFDKYLIPKAARVETEAAELRRQFYGFPGEFRLKEYGFEYRTLSCAPFWPKNHKVLKEILTCGRVIVEGYRGVG